MKPAGLKTKIFLDSGDPAETRQVLKFLGFLDGQTTNPSLIAKSPEAAGKKFAKAEVMDFYKSVAREVSSLIPGGSVSVEVEAGPSTPAAEMFEQGKKIFQWIPNAHVKYPATAEGLKAAEMSAREGLRVNMTLVFSQEQAAAVYAATAGAKIGDVFISPFVGRLDDVGENGMDLISNIVKMYRGGDGHVQVLSASVRTLEHFLASIFCGADIITAPLKVFKEWAETGKKLPPADFNYAGAGLKPMPYRTLDLNRPPAEYSIGHPLTEKGLLKFQEDWNNLLAGGH